MSQLQSQQNSLLTPSETSGSPRFHYQKGLPAQGLCSTRILSSTKVGSSTKLHFPVFWFGLPQVQITLGLTNVKFCVQRNSSCKGLLKEKQLLCAGALPTPSSPPWLPAVPPFQKHNLLCVSRNLQFAGKHFQHLARAEPLHTQQRNWALPLL